MPQGPEEPQSRHVPGGPGAPASYHQEGPKKRRTNDHEERSYEMPPPIRASMQKKVDSSVAPPKGTLVSMELHPLTTHNKKELAPKPLAHGYTPQASSSTTSTVKASSSKVPQVESVKFSKEKIKFAGETPGEASALAASSSSSTFKTPGTTKAGKKSKTPAAFKESPLYPNGESIVLPEIPTEYVLSLSCMASPGCADIVSATVPRMKTMTTRPRSPNSPDRSGQNPRNFASCYVSSKP